MSATGSARVGERVSYVRDLVKRFVTEAAGMSLFMLTSLGGVQDASASTLSISASFGAGLTLGLYASGGHLNPVVSVSAWLARKIDAAQLVVIVAAQYLGSLVAATVVYGTVPDKLLGATTPAPGYSNAQAFAIELYATLVLLAIVWASAFGPSPRQAPFVVGIAAFALHLACVPTSGASLNPARSFGPSVVSGRWTSHWVYYAGPLLGGIAGAFGVEAARIPDDSEHGESTAETA